MYKKEVEYDLEREVYGQNVLDPSHQMFSLHPSSQNPILEANLSVTPEDRQQRGKPWTGRDSTSPALCIPFALKIKPPVLALYIIRTDLCLKIKNMPLLWLGLEILLPGYKVH